MKQDPNASFQRAKKHPETHGEESNLRIQFGGGMKLLSLTALNVSLLEALLKGIEELLWSLFLFIYS